MNIDVTTESTEALTKRIDDAARAVATHMPFRVNVEADMGGTFALQVDLGTPHDSDDPDDSHDTAGIDPDDPNLRWWFNADGGEHAIESPYDITDRPEEVARWIVDQAARDDLPGIHSPGPIARARQSRATTPVHAAPAAPTPSTPAAALDR